MAGEKERQRIRQVNRALRRWFDDRGLPLDGIWEARTDDLEAQNGQLEELQCWALAFERHLSREAMERRGYWSPPLVPEIDLEVDWLRFERWLEEGPLALADASGLGPPSELEGLTEEQLRFEVERLSEQLEARGAFVSLVEGLPLTLQYAFLKSELEADDLDAEAPGTFAILSGCDGYCPGCFQRPWCDSGQELGWLEEDDPTPHFPFSSRLR